MAWALIGNYGSQNTKDNEIPKVYIVQETTVFTFSTETVPRKLMSLEECAQELYENRNTLGEVQEGHEGCSYHVKLEGEGRQMCVAIALDCTSKKLTK